MNYHIIAFFLGFCLDLIFGDPYFLPHPVRLIGKLITKIEKKLYKKQKSNNKKEFLQGMGLVILVLITVLAVTGFLLLGCYSLNVFMGMALEIFMTYQILAVKCLKVESMKVYQYLKAGNLEQARIAVSMIVGRDTENLDMQGVAKAAIETVAENACDGVIAPMLYLMIGGPILGFFYKAVNTMDSMIGYKNEKYFYFGKPAAKLDDFMNFFPSRISACLMIAVSFLGKDFSGKGAVTIYKRDRKKHASPNSAQTESVCAGALGIQLAGPASYFGKMVNKPYLGDSLRKVEYEDIKRANHFMYFTAWICEILCLSVLFLGYL